MAGHWEPGEEWRLVDEARRRLLRVAWLMSLWLEEQDQLFPEEGEGHLWTGS